MRNNTDLQIKEIKEKLIGAVIEDAHPSDEDGEDGWFTIVLKSPDGKRRFYVEPSIDPEGNAPGFLFIGEE